MADKAVGGGSRQKKNRKRWVIVFACFLANFTCGMIVLALPFLYQELLKRFGQSAAVTSGPFSFFKGLGYFLSPFGKFCIKRTSQRIAAIVGGCLMGVGFVIAAFAGNMGIVYLAFFVSGVGYSFVYLTSGTTLPLHFKRKKFLVLLIANSGFAIGSLICPYAFLFVLEGYGYTISFVYLTCLAALACVAGSLYFPVMTEGGSTDKEHAKEEESESKADSGSHINCSPVEVAIIEKTFDDSQAPSSTAQLEGTLGGVQTSGVKQRKGQHPENHIEILSSESRSDEFTSTDLQHNGTSLNATQTDRSPPGGPTTEITGQFGVEAVVKSTTKTSKRSACHEKLKYILSTYTDLHILKDKVFLAVALALLGSGFSSAVFIFLLILLDEKGFSRSDYVILQTAMSISTIFLVPLLGVLVSRRSVLPYVKYMYASACILNGCLVAIAGTVNSLPAFVAISLARTTVVSSVDGSLSGIMVELFGVDSMLEYTAGARMVQGIAYFTGPYIAGFIKDVVGSFVVAFLVGGGFAAICALLFLITLIRIRRQTAQYSTEKPPEEASTHIRTISYTVE